MEQSRIEQYFENKAQELVEAVSRLVRIDSTKGSPAPGMPFGEGPAKALDEALDLAQALGLPAENLEGYVGISDLNGEETALHILAHLDVVAPGSGWSVTTPFAPKLLGDLLYGRGTTDNKGPLVAALFAMKAVKDFGIPLKKNCRLIMGTDEESGFADIKWYFARYPYAPYTFSPDAEFPLTNLEKGHFQPFLSKEWPQEVGSVRVCSLSGSPQVNVIPPEAKAQVSGLRADQAAALAKQVEAELRVSLTLEDGPEGLSILCAGTGAHASVPAQGNNALTALLTFLTRLPLQDCESSRTLIGLSRLFPHGDHEGQALGIAQSDPLAGPLTLTMTMMHLYETGFEARFDSRTPLCTTEENCMEPVRQALLPLGISLRGEMTPPHHTPADSPFVQTLLRCYEQYTGQVGHCLSTGGGTYVHGIPGGVAYGTTMPGFTSALHGPDERVSISDLLTSCKIFTQVILDLCS